MLTNILGRRLDTSGEPMTMDEVNRLYRKTTSFDSQILQVKIGDTIESHSILPINVSCYPRIPYWEPGQLFKVCAIDPYKTISGIGVMPIINGKVVPNKDGAKECLWFKLGVLLLCSSYLATGLRGFRYPERLHSFTGAPDG